MAIPTMLKVGDEVMWRGGFGMHDAQPAVVKRIEVMESIAQKEGGEPVAEVPWINVIDRKVYIVVSLTNGSWAHGYQLDPKEI